MICSCSLGKVSPEFKKLEGWGDLSQYFTRAAFTLAFDTTDFQNDMPEQAKKLPGMGGKRVQSNRFSLLS
jgi:hypothetical protein